jgi:hypothetical protein
MSTRPLRLHCKEQPQRGCVQMSTRPLRLLYSLNVGTASTFALQPRCRHYSLNVGVCNEHMSTRFLRLHYKEQPFYTVLLADASLTLV